MKPWETSKGKKWNAGDVGCYADSSFGHAHVRETLAGLIEGYDAALATELCGEMSDDASEELDALDLLNADTDRGARWGFWEGGLFLMTESEWDEAES